MYRSDDHVAEITVFERPYRPEKYKQKVPAASNIRLKESGQNE